MTPYFADTFYYLALINPADEHHQKVFRVSRSLSRPVVTTAWVLTEIADGLCDRASRGLFLELLAEIRDDPYTTVVAPGTETFDAGLRPYGQRLDKEWSLTDCTSFAVVKQKHVKDALTADRHFTQAGFRILF